MEEKRMFVPAEELWAELAGKRILLAGAESELKRIFRENLACAGGRPGGEFFLGEESELPAGAASGDGAAWDFIFLFADDPAAVGTEPAGGGGLPEEQGFLRLVPFLRRLERLCSLRPSSLLLLSECSVYGKYYGSPRPRREEEMGYACHTDRRDEGIQLLRTEEHFACRMAGEWNVNLKVARAGRGLTGDSLAKMLEAALAVLLRGEPGEVYNLPADRGEERGVSPLSPLPVWMDSGKGDALRLRNRNTATAEEGVCCCEST